MIAPWPGLLQVKAIGLSQAELQGVVVLEGAASVSFEASLALVYELPAHWRRVLTYLIFLVQLEFVLRLARILVTGRLSTGEPPSAVFSETEEPEP